MTEDDTQLDENEQSTLDKKLDSEEADDLDSLFADDESQEDAPVTREEYNRLIKGTKKLASELGRLKSQPATKQETEETNSVSHQSDDVSELFYAQVPQAELVSDDLKSIAEAKYSGSILKAWKGESWIQEKALALHSAKSEEELNVSKVSKPSQGGAGVNRAFANIDLSSKKDVEWLNQKPGRRKEYMDWYAKH